MEASEGGDKVQLYVYDLSGGMAAQFSEMLVGHKIEAIYHTGIVVGGVEYYFGGGIQAAPVGQSPFGEPMRILDLGVTHLSAAVRAELLDDLSQRYTAESYSLLSNNCNNFSDELAQLLCGTGIPSYITGLPAEVLATPFGQMIRPMLDGLEVQLRSMRSQSWHQQVDAAAAEAEAAATVASAGEGPALLAAEKEIEAAMAAGMMQEAEAAGATTTTEGGAADNARLAAERAVSAAFQRVMAGGNVGEHDAQALAMEAVAAWQKQQQQAGSE